MSVTTNHGGYPDTSLPGYYERTPDLPSKIENGKPAFEEDAEPKKSYLVELIQEYADNGTAHGIPRIIGSHYIIAKFFWLILVCGLAAVFIWQGKGLILDFIDAPYNTKIDIITKTLVDFPAVTVCNMNRMRRSELVGTRFQGIVDVDGGFDLENEYSWFFDFSSDFYNDWYSDFAWSSSPGGGGGGGGPSSSSFGGSPSSGGGGGGRRRRAGSSSSSSVAASSSSSYGYGGSSSYGGYGGSSSYGGYGGSSSYYGGYGGSSSYYGGYGYYGSSSYYYYGGYYYGGGYYYSSSTPWWVNSWADDFGAWDFNAFDSFVFEYDDYYDWNVDGESDWGGFYAQSKSDDFSDIADIANPTREELRDYGHQADDFILQCTFDKRKCNTTWVEHYKYFCFSKEGESGLFDHAYSSLVLVGMCHWQFESEPIYQFSKKKLSDPHSGLVTPFIYDRNRTVGQI